MARLLALPHKAIIAGFRGVIDFYLYGACTGRPIPCARSWPRYDPSHYPETIAQGQAPLIYIMQHLGEIPLELIEAAHEQASGTSLTWRDVIVRCYINGERV